jgi:foldase protein PrsA
VSIDPATKSKGGQLGETIKGGQEKSLDTALFAAQVNQLGGPIKTPFGFYLFEVLSTKAPTQQTLKQTEATIKQQLQAQNQQGALSKFVKGFKKKWKGKTDCRSGFVVNDCKQFKEPKTKTGTTGTTGTTTK